MICSDIRIVFKRHTLIIGQILKVKYTKFELQCDLLENITFEKRISAFQLHRRHVDLLVNFGGEMRLN